MGWKKEWIWEMQGELTVADAASSRYRGMILRVSERQMHTYQSRVSGQ